MAKVCEMCGKRTQVGNNRSHSNRATKRKFFPNLFKKKIFVPVLGAAVRLKICTRCIRTAAKNA